MEVHPHAHKHGIGTTDILAVVASGTEGARVGDDPERWLVVGFDRTARAVEIVILMRSSGGALVIHAMPVRKGTLRAIRDAREEPR